MFCIFPVSTNLETMVVSLGNTEMFYTHQEELQYARSYPNDYQIFGELPQHLDGNADDYIKVFYEAKVKSNTLSDITSCELIFTDVENSEGRFLWSSRAAFHSALPPFSSNIATATVVVNKAGLNDDELDKLLHQVELQLICSFKSGKIKKFDIKPSKSIPVTYWDLENE